MGRRLPVPSDPNPTEYITIPLTIPNTQEWRGIYCGLLYSLSFGYWWDKNSGDWETAKNVGYAVALEACRSMSLCDEVADCIETNDGVREILRELIKETIYDGGAEGRNRNLGGGSASLEACTKDNVFGAVTYLVQYQIDAVHDFFELLETATNTLELVFDWIQDFGVVAPILAVITEYVEWVQDNIVENFDAQLTTALQDEYRCDLFCLYLEDCNGLSARQIADYYLGRISGAGFMETLDDLFDFLISGSWEGTQIVDAMMASTIAMMTVDLDWIPFITIPTTYSLQTIFQLGGNDPDPDWSILCTDCEAVNCYDMSDLTNIDIILGYSDPSQGHPEPSIHSASGVNSATYPLNASGTSNGISPAIRLNFLTPKDVNSLTFEYFMDASGTETMLRGYELREFGTNDLIARVVQTHDHNDANWHTWDVVGLGAHDVGAIVIWTSKTSNPTTTGTALLDNLCWD